MKNTNQKRGFTLIELLVVIVILGILSTISVGTFRSYFSKARDSERVSTVQNVAMMVKVDSGGIGDCTVYNYGADTDPCTAAPASFSDLFNSNDFSMSESKNNRTYYYGFDPDDSFNNDFFIAVAAEEDGAQNGRVVNTVESNELSVFVDGTVDAIAATTEDNVWNDAGAIETCPTNYSCFTIGTDGSVTEL